MSTTIEQEMLDCFIKLNESEKESFLQLLQTIIKSKEQSEILKIEEFKNDSPKPELKVETVRHAVNYDVEKKQDAYW